MGHYVDCRRGCARMTGLLLMVGALFLLGCASQAELPPQAIKELGDLRDQLVQGKAQIQVTSNAARELVQRPQAQLEPQVKRVVDSIAALDDLATNHRKEFQSADARAQAYFAHWQRQLQTMSEETALRGEKRRAESMASFEELKARTEALRQDFRPYMSSLLEVSRYLQTDMTTAGVNAVAPQIKAAVDREKNLLAKADAVIAQIDAMRGGK